MEGDSDEDDEDDIYKACELKLHDPLSTIH